MHVDYLSEPALGPVRRRPWGYSQLNECRSHCPARRNTYAWDWAVVNPDIALSAIQFHRIRMQRRCYYVMPVSVEVPHLKASHLALTTKL